MQYSLLFLNSLSSNFSNSYLYSLPLEEPHYDECEDAPALQKTNYLNAAIFNQQILNPSIYNNDDTSETINIVYFFKPGCPNCSAVSKALNVFIDDLTVV